MVQLIARRPLVYAGKRFAAGDTFEAPGDRPGGHAFLLRAVRSADYAEAAATPAAPKRKRGRPRKVAAETPAPIPPDDPPDDDETPDEPLETPEAKPRARRRYKRRDLRAE